MDTMKARAMQVSGSSASFISEHLAQNLCLPRTSQSICFFLAILSPRSLWTFSPAKKLVISAVIIPCVTCNLPLQPMTSGATLLDCSSQIQSLDSLGRLTCCWELMEVFTEVVLQGRQLESPGSTLSLVGFWLGEPNFSHHTALLTGDDLLH